MKKTNTLISVFTFLATSLFILSFSISLPIFIRPFYYAHIDAFDLPSSSGFTKTEIKIAYDEVLDYLTNPCTTTFSAGNMKFSSDGAAHFLDCKKLFTTNFVVLLLSSFFISFTIFFKKRKKITTALFINHSPIFWSGITTLVSTLICGILIPLDPESAFTIFHKIFFPGKTNWVFNPYTDEIINVLPQDFFFNCAILIGLSILILSTLCITSDFIKKGKSKR